MLGIFAFVFPEGVLVVNTCIQVGYSGVAHGKLEIWLKLGGIRVFST